MQTAADVNLAVDEAALTAEPGMPNERRASRVVLTVVALALFAVCSLVFRNAGAPQVGGDSLWVLPTSWQITAHQTLVITPYADQYAGGTFRAPKVAYGTIPDKETGRERYNYFPWGASIVAMPFVWVEAARVNATGGDFERTLRREIPARGYEIDVAALMAAATVVAMFFLVWLRTRSFAWSLGFALVFAFGTSIASSTSRALWVQAPGVLASTITLMFVYALSTSKWDSKWRTGAVAFGAGSAAVLGYMCRPQLMLLIPIVAIIALRRNLAAAIGAAAGGAAVMIPFVIVNLSVFGSVLPPYYEGSRLAIRDSFTDALAANLVSPARGLLIWSPVVLVGLVAYLAHVRRAPLLDHLLVVWFVVHLVAVSSFGQWWAGWSVGPRFMADVLPALFLLAAAAPQMIAATRQWTRVACYSALAVLVVWSVVANVDGMESMDVVLWNGKVNIDSNPSQVWNWSDPQIISGLRG